MVSSARFQALAAAVRRAGSVVARIRAIDPAMRHYVLMGTALVGLGLFACSSDESSGSSSSSGAASSSSSSSSSSSGSGASSSGGGSSSSSGAASSSSSSSGSPSDSGTANRCDVAAERVEARYDECDVSYAILDGGAGEACTEERAADAEALADCIAPISCAALRGDSDAPDRDAYFACLAP